MSKNNFIKHAESVKHLAKAIEIQTSIAEETGSKNRDIIEKEFPGLLADVIKLTDKNDMKGILEKLKMIKKAEDASKRSNNE